MCLSESLSSCIALGRASLSRCLGGLAYTRCDGSTAVRGGRKRTHEEIGSQCARAKGFDVEENEGAWAQSEVGEGVEEVWERAVSLGWVDGARWQ